MSVLAILVTTVDDEAQARALAEAVLASRLAGCAQMHKIRSFYVWQGEQREDDEVQLQMPPQAARWLRRYQKRASRAGCSVRATPSLGT